MKRNRSMDLSAPQVRRMLEKTSSPLSRSVSLSFSKQLLLPNVLRLVMQMEEIEVEVVDRQKVTVSFSSRKELEAI